MNLFSRFLLPFLLIAVVCRVEAADLTPEMRESLRSKAEALRNELKDHLTNRNQGAGEKFLSAASDPRAAVELYLTCYKTVHFDREERPEADFRAWRDSQADRLKDPQFVESLQHQLRYLGLSCQAAEAESVDAVFSSLMSYVEGLSRLEELPSGNMTESVANSVFAETFYLKDLLGKNEKWEPVPFNISGIYERTILPHLREKQPEALMNAWDKRIEQETRIVMMLEAKKEEALRGMDRDQVRRERSAQNREQGVMGKLDKDDFKARTLPTMQWGKLKDMFTYVDEVEGAKAMLDFLSTHLKHELGERFFAEFESLIGVTSDAGSSTPAEATAESN